jgi:hypothetical protein
MRNLPALKENAALMELVIAALIDTCWKKCWLTITSAHLSLNVGDIVVKFVLKKYKKVVCQSL